LNRPAGRKPRCSSAAFQPLTIQPVQPPAPTLLHDPVPDSPVSINLCRSRDTLSSGPSTSNPGSRSAGGRRKGESRWPQTSTVPSAGILQSPVTIWSTSAMLGCGAERIAARTGNGNIPTPLFRQLRQAARLILRDQRAQQFVHLPFENLGQPVQRQVDAMVGHAALREIIGADTFASVA